MAPLVAEALLRAPAAAATDGPARSGSCAAGRGTAAAAGVASTTTTTAAGVATATATAAVASAATAVATATATIASGAWGRAAGSGGAAWTASPLLGLTHAQWPALQVLPVEPTDGRLGLLFGGELDEAKTARPLGLAILDDAGRNHFAELGKSLAQRAVVYRVR